MIVTISSTPPTGDDPDVPPAWYILMTIGTNWIQVSHVQKMLVEMTQYQGHQGKEPYFAP